MGFAGGGEELDQLPLLSRRQMAELPLVALADVPAANIFGRAWDTVRLWFK